MRHYKGGLYEVVGCGLIEADKSKAVVYRCLKSDVIWVRPIENFVGANESGAPRFTRARCPGPRCNFDGLCDATGDLGHVLVGCFACDGHWREEDFNG